MVSDGFTMVTLPAPPASADELMRGRSAVRHGTRPTRAREKAVGRSAFGVQLAARHSFECPLRTHTLEAQRLQHRDHLAGLAAFARRTGVRGGLGRFFAPRGPRPRGSRL